MSDRLWITGLGLVTPLGMGVEQTWAALVRGDRAIGPIRLFDAVGQRVSIAGEVAGIPWPSDLPGHSAAWSRTSVMAEAAASEAMHTARLDAHESRVGLVVGGTTGGMLETEQFLAQLLVEPASREALSALLSHPLTATGDCLERSLGPFARVRTLSSACSSGANAIVVAASWLLTGEVDAVVAGGSDALCRLTLSGFNALAALDPTPCRPFDRRRRGTSLGEGAGFVVLERAAHASARGARPIGVLAGWAVGSEAHHITNPAPDGGLVASLVAHAIARAGLAASDIDYVNAHGTGTQQNDAMEAAALALAFGSERRRVAVSSSKGQIGHTLGAAGAIEAVITTLVVSRRTLVPTAGLDEPDPALDLAHVPHVGREVSRVRAALSNAFGFGGMDTVLVITEPDLHRSEAPARPSAVVEDRSVVVTGVAVFGPCGRLGAAECATLPGKWFALDAAVDPDAHLDAMKARRLDRAARLGAVAVDQLIAQSGAPTVDTGLLLGSAFANVDPSAAFMRRVFEKGARAASPAEFPNLVPSASVGHVSIYTGLHGPAFATADLEASGESAFVQASQLVRCGEAPRIVAGAVEPRSGMVQRVLSTLFEQAPSLAGAMRADLAVAILVEAEEEARARGARILARIEQVLEWRGDGAGALASLRGPRSARAQVLLPRASEEADRVLASTSWTESERVVCAPVLGESDALGAVAIAVAASRIGAGVVEEALMLGLAKGRGFAIVLAGAAQGGT
ncbi:MAG: beta-ketoacyl synthase N-terminal-like domain-containing protein [Polyangiaceae bacterium]